MKFVVDKSELDYLLCSRCNYTPAHMAALVANSFEDNISDIAMNGSEFTDDNARANDALVPDIFSTLAEQVLTATITNEQDFRGFYEAFQDQFMGAVSMDRIIMIFTTD